MEQTIDRKSYRRSGRLETPKEITKVAFESNIKSYNIIKMFLNQIIVSLLIIFVLLLIKYFEVPNVLESIKKYFVGDFTSIKAIALLKEKYNSYINLDKKNANISGEQSLYTSLDVASGESLASGDFIEAVEGINQLSIDAKELNDKYDFILPVEGTITSKFGVREKSGNIISGYHTGLDIAQSSGISIKAAHSGMVILADNFSSYGNCVMIQDGDLITVYAHCSKLEVSKGQSVTQGQIIARVGMTGNATGTHVHFEIRYKDRYVDPEDVLEL